MTRAIPVLLALACASGLRAEDWPQWRGEGRLGVWAETGILERFPEAGLEESWRRPIHRGYAGPAVAAGKVFVTEFEAGGGALNRGVERVLCLDEQTGAELWRQEWAADYAGLQYDLGPRATPTVDDDRVYVLGAMGDLLCLRVEDGSVIWRTQYQKDFAASLPTWGFVGAPLVDGDQLIALVGGAPDAKVVSFDKLTGKELWRSLSGETEPGYAPPFLIEAGGARQLIVWTPQAVHSLDPASGKVYWQEPFSLGAGLAVATPVLSEHGLLVSAFYNGSRMYRLASDTPAAELVWKGNSDSEIETDGLHSLVTTPVVDGDYIYGIGSYGHLRCLDARTGKRVWETLDLTQENARWASGQIVRNGDRYFINNDRGDLILAKLSPEGYEEIDRVRVMKPTNPLNRRRELGAVHWTHPAYANRHMIIRNDEEIVRYSLEK
jgi:outer membrane protein assembly factor BamB